MLFISINSYIYGFCITVRDINSANYFALLNEIVYTVLQLFVYNI